MITALFCLGLLFSGTEICNAASLADGEDVQNTTKTTVDSTWTSEDVELTTEINSNLIPVSTTLPIRLLELLSAKLERLEVRLDKIESRIENKLDNVENRVTTFLENMDRHITDVEQRWTSQVTAISNNAKDRADEVKVAVSSTEQRVVSLLESVKEYLLNDKSSSEDEFRNIHTEMFNTEQRQTGQLTSLVSQIEDKIKIHVKSCQNEDTSDRRVQNGSRNPVEEIKSPIPDECAVTLRKDLEYLSVAIISNITDSFTKLMSDCVVKKTAICPDSNRRVSLGLKNNTESHRGSDTTHTDTDYNVWIRNITNDFDVRIANMFAEYDARLDNFADRVFDIVDKMIDARIYDMTSSLKEHTVLQLSALEEKFDQILDNQTDIFKQTISSETSKVEELDGLDRLLRPDSCKRGLIALPYNASFPHPVILPNVGSKISVPFLCDVTTDRGGWVVIQHRSRGDVEFYRGWSEYKHGFGSLTGDFWLGFETIQNLTSSATYQLRIDLEYQGRSAYASYSTFSVGSESENYRLQIGSYSGTAGDDLTYHNGMGFTTMDRDNDKWTGNCANEYKGAWWYNQCHFSHLNGQWIPTNMWGAAWNQFTGSNSASFIEMKIRPVSG